MTRSKAANRPTGWVHDPDAVDNYLATLRRPVFGVSAHSLNESGRGAVALLHKCVERVAGRFPVRLQTIGDCVSQGYATGVDVLKCVEIDLAGESEQWVAETASEPIYAASRVEIGGGRLSGDGSVGAWAAKAVAELGTVCRQRIGSVDLTTYDGDRARRWGRRGAGVPDSIEPAMREHLVRSVSLVSTYEEARDAIANGYPVPVCSTQGFQSRRDADGFARPSGSWAHCMAFVAVDDEFGRPGLLCVNSWGPGWIRGPVRHGQPAGSFWVDADVADRMLRARDSFALSNFEGYPARNLDYLLI